MRIEAFLRQSPMFQASRMARRMEASLNDVLEDEGVTMFEALVLTAIFFEGGSDQAVGAGGGVSDDSRKCEPLRLVAGGEGVGGTKYRPGGRAGGTAFVARAGEEAGGACGGDTGRDAAAV